MAFQNYMCRPMGVSEIHGVAHYLRETLKLSDEDAFPVLDFMEKIWPSVDENFYFGIKEKSEMPGIHGLTDAKTNCIFIREDVYEGAVANKGRDRMTIMHEFFHYICHTPSNILCRVEPGQIILPKNDPEWQANCFGGEILAPVKGIKGKSIDHIAKQYMVSRSAAEVQLKRT